MDLKVMIANGHFSVQGNYFIIAQLDEIQFPAKERKSHKQRTEVLAQTSNPTFKKNLFSFKNVSYGSRITVKFGVFMTNLMSEPEKNQDLLQKSKMVGSAAITLTQKLISLLRQEKKIEHNLQILKQDSQKEIGRLSIILKYKSSEISEQIRDDSHKIKENYYDLFEKDPEQIKQKCLNVQTLLLEKQTHLNKQMKKIYFIRNAHKSVSYDLGSLRKQRDELETQNEILREKVKQYNDIYDIHIHIDMLKQTDQGIDVLREKYVHIMNKLNFERSVYNELSENYFHIETQIQKTKSIQKEIDQVNQAGEELQFHLKRATDILPQVDKLKNTIQTQESIIKNLQSNIQNFLKDQDRVTSKDLKVKVEQMTHQKQLLLQKQQQLQLILKQNKGDLDYKEFDKFRQHELLKEDPEEIQYFQKKNETLMKEIEECTQQLEILDTEHQQKMEKLQENDIGKHMDCYDSNQILFEIENKENQAYQLQEELILSTKRIAQELADLKIKRNLLDNLIEANTQHRDL